MKQLRKLVKATPNFKYAVEYINLVSMGKVECIDGEIPCAHTNLRSLKQVYYEVYDWRGKKWYPVSEADYYKTIRRHKESFVKIRNKIKKERPQIAASDLFTLDPHFEKRLAERFQNILTGEYSTIDFMLDNGYRIVEDLREDMYELNRFAIYEPMSRMLVIATENEHGILLITIYEPSKYNWITTWLKTHKLTKDMLLRKYVNETFEVQEAV